jgi:hypothetical protein
MFLPEHLFGYRRMLRRGEEKMTDKDMTNAVVSKRVSEIPRSAIHEMTRLSMQVKDPVSLSWAKPAAGR